MDLNYLLGREQHALFMAETSLSTSARMAHRAFAKAYGELIAESGFPHRATSEQRRWPASQSRAQEREASLAGWKSESVRQEGRRKPKRSPGHCATNDYGTERA
jgi:hypothetical protein